MQNIENKLILQTEFNTNNNPKNLINLSKKNQMKAIYKIDLSDYVLPRSNTQCNTSLQMYNKNLKIGKCQLQNYEDQPDTPYFRKSQEQINSNDTKYKKLFVKKEKNLIKNLKERLIYEQKRLTNQKKLQNRKIIEQETYDSVLEMFTNRKKLIEENQKKKSSNLQKNIKYKQVNDILVFKDINYSTETTGTSQQVKLHNNNTFKNSKLQLQIIQKNVEGQQYYNPYTQTSSKSVQQQTSKNMFKLRQPRMYPQPTYY